MTLAHALIGDPHAPRGILLVHGLLASGRNLRSLARALTQRMSGSHALLVDLPGHGGSPELGLSDDITTVRGCAAAVASTARELEVRVDTVIGHSFGGKVSLLLSEHLPGIERVWTLDTSLDADPDWRNRSDVASVIAALRSVRVPTPERKDVADQLTTAGLSRRIADWMTTNLQRTRDGYRWVFDLDQIELLTDDYFRIDAVNLLQKRKGTPFTHLLRAENGERWTPESLARAEELSKDQVALHELPDAGHWVHADNLPGLLELLTAHP